MNGLRAAARPAVALTLWLCVLAPARAAPQTPLEVVRTTVDAVIEVLRDGSAGEAARKRRVRAVVARSFDFGAMSHRVLALNWGKATQAQRARFVSLFRELLTNTYWGRISGYSNETVAYTDEHLRSARLATVRTVITTDSADIPVDYKLYLKDDQWLAYDVVIEQVSLVRNYRGSFQDIVHESGIEGLLSALELKVAESSGADDPAQ